MGAMLVDEWGWEVRGRTAILILAFIAAGAKVKVPRSEAEGCIRIPSKLCVVYGGVLPRIAQRGNIDYPIRTRSFVTE